MAHNPPRFHWMPRHYGRGYRYELMVNSRPVGYVYWCKDGDELFYVGEVYGVQVPGGRFPPGHRADVMRAVEEAYRDWRYGGGSPASTAMR